MIYFSSPFIQTKLSALCLTMLLFFLPTSGIQAQTSAPAAPAGPTIQLITGQPASLPWIGTLTAVFANEVNVYLMNAGRPRLTWQTALGTQGLTDEKTFDAVASGAVPLGFTAHAIITQKLPLTDFPSSVPFLTSNPTMASAAIDESFQRSSILQEHWQQANLRPLTSIALDSYQLLRKQPVTSDAEIFAGTYIAPPAVANWFKDSPFTVQPVAIPDILARLAVEDIDGILIPLSLAKGLDLIKAAPHLVQLNLAALPVGYLVIHAKTWDSLSPLMQTALSRAAVQYREYVATVLAIAATQAQQEINTTNGSIWRAQRSTQEKLAQSLTGLVRTYQQTSGESSGVLLKTYQDILTDAGQIPVHTWITADD